MSESFTLKKQAEAVRNAVMIDIETMSTEKNASILTIGATPFDPHGDDTEDSLRAKSALFGPISISSNQEEGRHICGDTVLWWMQQSEQARKSLVEGTPMQLKNAIAKFAKWIAQLEPKPTEVWANSPSFDLVILQSAFKQVNVIWPFFFSTERDLRTIKNIAYPDNDMADFSIGTAHDAVDDTIKQALMVQHFNRIIKVDRK